MKIRGDEERSDMRATDSKAWASAYYWLETQRSDWSTYSRTARATPSSPPGPAQSASGTGLQVEDSFIRWVPTPIVHTVSVTPNSSSTSTSAESLRSLSMKLEQGLKESRTGRSEKSTLSF